MCPPTVMLGCIYEGGTPGSTVSIWGDKFAGKVKRDWMLDHTKIKWFRHSVCACLETRRTAELFTFVGFRIVGWEINLRIPLAIPTEAKDKLAEKDKQEILSLFVLSPVVVVSFLLRQRVVVQQAVGSCLACVRVEAFGSFLLLQRSCSAELRVLLGSVGFLESCFVLEES